VRQEHLVDFEIPGFVGIRRIVSGETDYSGQGPYPGAASDWLSSAAGHRWSERMLYNYTPLDGLVAAEILHNYTISTGG